MLTNTGPGWEAVAAGHRDEDDVMASLAGMGWGVSLYGSRVYNPATSPALGNATLLDAMVSTRHPIRHAPDLVAGHPSMGVCLVEVIRSPHEDLGLAICKLNSMDAWLGVAPIVIVDMHTGMAHRHKPMWGYRATSNVTRFNNVISDDAYAYFQRPDDERPLADFFRIQERQP